MVAGPDWDDMHPSAFPTPAPERCGLCHFGPVESFMNPPIGSRNAAYPLRVCNECSARVMEALSDLPWLRYVLSRYVPPAPGAPRWERLNR